MRSRPYSLRIFALPALTLLTYLPLHFCFSRSLSLSRPFGSLTANTCIANHCTSSSICNGHRMSKTRALPPHITRCIYRLHMLAAPLPTPLRSLTLRRPTIERLIIARQHSPALRLSASVLLCSCCGLAAWFFDFPLFAFLLRVACTCVCAWVSEWVCALFFFI